MVLVIDSHMCEMQLVVKSSYIAAATVVAVVALYILWLLQLKGQQRYWRQDAGNEAAAAQAVVQTFFI